MEGSFLSSQTEFFPECSKHWDDGVSFHLLLAAFNSQPSEAHEASFSSLFYSPSFICSLLNKGLQKMQRNTMNHLCCHSKSNSRIKTAQDKTTTLNAFTKRTKKFILPWIFPKRSHFMSEKTASKWVHTWSYCSFSVSSNGSYQSSGVTAGGGKTRADQQFGLKKHNAVG